jgi:hypothetical protein
MNPSESQPDTPPALLISSEGIILDAHDAICAALGWARESLVNKTAGDLFEYGADLVLIRMQEIQSGASDETEFSVSALVRRQDQSHFPTTAIVRRIAELDCFNLGFDDLAIEASPANEVQQAFAVSETPGPGAESVQQIEQLEAVEPALESLDIVGAMRVSAPESAQEPVREVHAIAPKPSVSHGNGNGNGSNGGNTTFRNIFLSSSQRQPNGKNEVAAQLETERQERKRLEARVLALTDQLKQLHAQLQHNLESENIFQKRVCESEDAVKKAEQCKAEAEAALDEKEKAREHVEKEFTEFKGAQEQFELERKAAQQEWLAKLETSLAALKESDARLAKELEIRRSIQATLQGLKEDFRVQAGRVLEFHRSEDTNPPFPIEVAEASPA